MRRAGVGGTRCVLTPLAASLSWLVAAASGCSEPLSRACEGASCPKPLLDGATAKGSQVGINGPDSSVDSSSDLGRDEVDASSVGLPEASDPGDGAPADAAIDCDFDASPATSSCPVSEAMGVFVSPGGDDDTGVGTRARPYRTLQKALRTAKVAGGRVYACDNATGYSESIEIGPMQDGIELYGGFDCLSWTYRPARRARVVAPKAVALTISSLSLGIRIEDFVFESAPGAHAGESSIGVLLNESSNVTLRRVEIVSSAGRDGSAGQNGGGADGTPAAGGAAGRNGVDACTKMVIEGGTGKTLGGETAAMMCGTTETSGGAGGTGGIYTGTGVNGVSPNSPGGAGVSGLPRTDGGYSGGQGGPGETNTETRCSIGGAGVAGRDGQFGLGARGLGTLDVTGWIGPAGAEGEPGQPGQGGGGGGGAKSPAEATACPSLSPDPKTGASGGSGGGGGCGGLPGAGGKPGGSSIAIVSLHSKNLTLDACTLRPGVGGKGGNGGKGQLGGQGGAAGRGGWNSVSQAQEGCAGGPGGGGGSGGPGGGGLGGHSIGVAYKGTAPNRIGGNVMTSSAGAGGLSGGGAPDSGDYAAGRGDNGRSLVEAAF